ncbi:MAG: YqgE/AlgH family protein [Gammaproteobacteria bacterium]|nr:YqgE/AlgH family protein [Gammaproteobacteria bacterium]MBT8074846.1 YqgE/AlgH family protein [Gammaproteobacteria bacterium]
MNLKSQDVVSGYLQQQMLIAMPAMADPNFSRSVTLLCQHNEEGAIGITINRESDFTLGELFFQLNISCENEEISSMAVLEGGPVSPDHGFVLHTPVEGFDSSIMISDEIMVTTSRDVLSAIAEGKGPQKFLVALGYAGWGDGQLESEMRQNAWLSVPADQDIVFESALQKRWEKAVGKLGININDLHGVGGYA